METEHSKMEDEGQNAPSLSLKDGAFCPSSSILFPHRRCGDHSGGRDQLWALKGCSDHIADCSKQQFLIEDRNANCGEHVAPSESIHHDSRV